METVLLVIGIAAVILLAALIVIVLISNQNKVDEQYLARQISADISRQQSELRQELTAQTQNSVGAMGGMLEQRLQGFAAENQRSLNSIRDTVEKRLNEIQTDNARQLDEMRRTVDEKLNKSLDEKFSNSFSLVSQRLEQVYKGLGEMQNLAVGVGDLKKVLMMHFPPFTAKQEDTLFSELFEKNGVDKVVFGHIHGASYFPLKSYKNGIEYILASCDKVGFNLVKIY